VSELLIRGGTLIDGTGRARRRADVMVDGGVITEIGLLGGRKAKRIVEAEGQIVSPGFVDVHTHMDAQIAWDPMGESSCFHGVTTAVMGNCGFTLAPVRSDERHLVVRNLERAEDISAEAMAAGIDWSWETFPEYLNFVERTPKGINYAGYIGHSALRTWAMGERAFEDSANEDDLALMVGQLRSAMKSGAMGFTTSVSVNHATSDDRPVASRMADWSEVELLVSEMGKLGAGIFELAHHHDLRSRDLEKRELYISRLVELAVRTGVPVTYGMLATGKGDLGWKPVVELLDRINSGGGRSWAQVHTRQFGVLLSFSTQLPFDSLPIWKELREATLKDQLLALRDPGMRSSLIYEAEHGDYGRSIGAEARKPEWEFIYPMVSALPPYRSIAEIAVAENKKPIDVFLDVSVSHNLDIFFIQAAANQDQSVVLDLMKHPFAIPTFSDSGAHVTQIMDSSIQTHLLGHWVRNEKAFSLEEAIHRMTLVPARAWGFDDRGILAEGKAADINIFDSDSVSPNLPELLHDLPSGAARLRQTSVGIKATIVNGDILVEDGETTGSTPGLLLRGPLAR
jgi:N-acyl-D-amino-acid deacylase|tara:strand:- start:6007 stop:7713 length:1707 start_codon:yes stop_codon:yes gene_type:complete